MTQASELTASDVPREYVAIDHFVNFRSKIRDLSVQELKTAKMRSRAGNVPSEDSQLATIRESLIACDAVRTIVLDTAGILISDAPASQEGGKNSMWHFVDNKRKK